MYLLYYGEDGNLYVHNVFFSSSNDSDTLLPVSVVHQTSQLSEKIDDTELVEMYCKIIQNIDIPVKGNSNFWGITSEEITGNTQFEQIQAMIMFNNMNRPVHQIQIANMLEATANIKQNIKRKCFENIYQIMKNNPHIMPSIVKNELDDFLATNQKFKTNFSQTLIGKGFVHVFDGKGLTNTSYITDSRNQQTYSDGEKNFTYKLHITPTRENYEGVASKVADFLSNNNIPGKIILDKGLVYNRNSPANMGKGITLYPITKKDFEDVMKFIQTLTSDYQGFIPNTDMNLSQELLINDCGNLLRYTPNTRDGEDFDYRERRVFFERHFGIGPLDGYAITNDIDIN